MHNNNIPNHQVDSYMQDLNEALEIQGDEFRFPKTVATLLNRSHLHTMSSDGIKYYAVCPVCYHLSDQKEQPTANDIECNRNLIGAPYKPTGSGEFCNGRVYDYDGSREVPKLVVQKEYPYCSIVATLKKFFLRRGFADKIVEWKDRETVDGYYLDLYDTPGFSQFKTSPSDPTSFVFSGNYNLLLNLNVD